MQKLFCQLAGAEMQYMPKKQILAVDQTDLSTDGHRDRQNSFSCVQVCKVVNMGGQSGFLTGAATCQLPKINKREKRTDCWMMGGQMDGWIEGPTGG